MRIVTGWLLLILPFAAATSIMAMEHGWMFMALVWAVVATIVGVFVTGFWLIGAIDGG